MTTRLQRGVWTASGGVCHWCGVGVDHDTGSIDHVVARSKGGRHKRSNVVVACYECNTRKGNRDADEWVESSRWLHHRIAAVKRGEAVSLRSVGAPLKTERIRPSSRSVAP